MNLRDVVKAQTTRGFRNALRAVRREYAIQRAHRASLTRLKRSPLGANMKLHVGCGNKIKAGWINIDLFSSKADLQLDMREDLPFADDSVSMIYSEHFLEHLEYPVEALKFLSESIRVLIPGGVFSVGVPDTEWAVTAYVNGDEEYFRLAREVFHPQWCTTRMHHLNYHFRQGLEHKYAYDFETLAQILDGIGFLNAERRPFNPSLDSEDREKATLYIDATKPK